jgi:hypothetical protein
MDLEGRPVDHKFRLVSRRRGGGGGFRCGKNGCSGGVMGESDPLFCQKSFDKFRGKEGTGADKLGDLLGNLGGLLGMILNSTYSTNWTQFEEDSYMITGNLYHVDMQARRCSVFLLIN